VEREEELNATTEGGTRHRQGTSTHSNGEKEIRQRMQEAKATKCTHRLSGGRQEKSKSAQSTEGMEVAS